MNALLDTNILVDLLRAWTPALNWLALQHQSVLLGVSPVVWLELLQGAPNKAEQRRAYELLSRFTVVDMLREDYQWAVEKLMLHSLSHHVMAMDALIAAPAARLNIPLYTHNLKHFTPILGELAQRPY